MSIQAHYDVGYANGYKAGRRDALAWIPCSERMPTPQNWHDIYDAENDRHGAVLVWVAYGKHMAQARYFVDRYGGKAWHIDGSGFTNINNITHWMPLPAPPAPAKEQG